MGFGRRRLPSLPRFFFDVGGWRGSRSVQRMTFEERGVYLEMMLEQWERKSLPDDVDAVVDLLAVTADHEAAIRRAWPVVRRKFEPCQNEPGRVANRRLEITRREQRLYQIKKQDAGAEGGKARAAKALAKRQISSSIAQANPSSAQANASTAQANSSDLIRSDQIRSEEKRESPQPLARPVASVFDGALPRNHRAHAECSPNHAWCVPAAVHQKLREAYLPRVAGDVQKADQALRRWYPTVWATLAADFVMPEAFRFWQGHFDAAHADQSPKPDARRPDPVSTVPSAAETRRRLLS